MIFKDSSEVEKPSTSFRYEDDSDEPIEKREFEKQETENEILTEETYDLFEVTPGIRDGRVDTYSVKRCSRSSPHCSVITIQSPIVELAFSNNLNISWINSAYRKALELSFSLERDTFFNCDEGKDGPSVPSLAE